MIFVILLHDGILHQSTGLFPEYLNDLASIQQQFPPAYVPSHVEVQESTTHVLMRASPPTKIKSTTPLPCLISQIHRLPTSECRHSLKHPCLWRATKHPEQVVVAVVCLWVWYYVGIIQPKRYPFLSHVLRLKNMDRGRILRFPMSIGKSVVTLQN